VADGAPAPDRFARRRARTRAALLAAAREVFAKRGLDGTTIQAIADAADVGKGSFYNHFDSREDVLAAAAHEALEELGAALDRRFADPAADPARVVAGSLLATLDRCVCDPVLGGFLLHAGEIFDVAAGALGERGRRDLERGRRAGRFDYADADVLIALIGGGLVQLLRGRLRGELPPRADVELAALLLRCLGLPPEEATALAAAAAAERAGSTAVAADAAADRRGSDA
jgi:AcrR family transcriptional regulator